MRSQPHQKRANCRHSLAVYRITMRPTFQEETDRSGPGFPDALKRRCPIYAKTLPRLCQRLGQALRQCFHYMSLQKHRKACNRATNLKSQMDAKEFSVPFLHDKLSGQLRFYSLISIQPFLGACIVTTQYHTKS